MKREIFLDNNATTKPLPEVKDAVASVLGDEFGNPSSENSSGDRGRCRLSQARSSVAQLIGADDDSIVFTGSGTEANNLVLFSATAGNPEGARIVTCSVEHSSILKCVEHLAARGAEIVVLPVNQDGRIDLCQAEKEITKETSLVSFQWANNETGVIQPIEDLLSLCHRRNVPLHTDAAQIVGKLPIDVTALPIDLLTMTAHKIHGPQGVGAIYARSARWLSPLYYGGPQEKNLRPGTENVPGIVGFGKAAETRSNNLAAVISQIQELRNRFERLVLDSIPDVAVNGDIGHRTCNTTNLRFTGVDGQALVAGLDSVGICCSQTSACTNARPEPSYVLRAMSLTEEDAYSSVRFSFGVFNSDDDVDRAVSCIVEICKRLRGFSSQIHNPYTAEKV